MNMKHSLLSSRFACTLPGSNQFQPSSRRTLEVSLRGLMFALAVLGFVSPALATEIFDDTTDSCALANCSSIYLPGSILNHVGVSPHPWVAQLSKEIGPCMRLDVIYQQADLEIVAVAPDGTVYRNDDRNGSLKPLVVVPPNTRKGWYTVQVSHYAGSPVEPNFALAYGTYTPGSPNCANPHGACGGGKFREEGP